MEGFSLPDTGFRLQVHLQRRRKFGRFAPAPKNHPASPRKSLNMAPPVNRTISVQSRTPYINTSTRQHINTPLHQPLQYQIDHPQQKHHNRDLINPVHHLNVDVGRTCGILSPEEISSNLSQRKELFPASLLLVVRVHSC